MNILSLALVGGVLYFLLRSPGSGQPSLLSSFLAPVTAPPAAPPAATPVSPTAIVILPPASGLVSVDVYDPVTGATTLLANPYPALAPTGYHWENAGYPGAQMVGGIQPPPLMILVRDGYNVPAMR
jgi:hypothetical protein